MIDEKKLIEVLKKHFDADYGEDGRLLYSDHVCTSDDVEDIIKLVEEQPRVGEWIPCSERLPEEPEDGFKRYIVQRANRVEPSSLYWDQYGTWLDEDGTPYDVIAWMPLPEPYLANTNVEMEDACE